jgi:hypothetical protein
MYPLRFSYAHVTLRRMRRASLLFLSASLAVVSFPTRASAQVVDLAAGYSLLTFGSECPSDCTIPAGWFGTFGVRVTPAVGFVADVSGAYKSIAGASYSEHAYLFGPRLQWGPPDSQVRIYGQLTFGGVTGRVAGSGLSDSSTVFAIAPGLAVDVRMDAHWAVRGGVNFRSLKPQNGGAWFKETQVIVGLAYSAQ